MNRSNLKSGNMRVLACLLKAGESWLSPDEIARLTGVPLGSVGSRIRDLRNDGFVVNKLHDRTLGGWRYGVPASLRESLGKN